LICDNDKKYEAGFERVAERSGIEVIHTPYRAPLANAICERFIGNIRRECSDHVLVLSLRQLARILTEYVRYFTQARPHQGIGQQIPERRPLLVSEPQNGKVIASPGLNRLHHGYRWAA
jgi:transposase InsO family protein